MTSSKEIELRIWEVGDRDMHSRSIQWEGIHNDISTRIIRRDKKMPEESNKAWYRWFNGRGNNGSKGW